MCVPLEEGFSPYQHCGNLDKTTNHIYPEHVEVIRKNYVNLLSFIPNSFASPVGKKKPRHRLTLL